MEDEYEGSSSMSANNLGAQDSTFLQFRLDNSKLIDQIRVTLSGKLQQAYIDEKGVVKTQVVEVSIPLVNKEGFSAIVNYVTTQINNQVVQGNIDADYHANYCADLREDFAFLCIINMYEWDIKEQYFDYIVDTTINTIKLFLTRLIGNKERESYGTMHIRDSQTKQMKKTGMGFK